ncbi:MAG: hypothetical protein KIT49_09510 [Nitrospira sp.]|nr:hypothetical protein [Nitrospira sp.]
MPRFEVDLNAKESLFKKFGITYDQFSALSEDGRMKYIRKYARGRMKPGERLWWLEEESSDGHSLPMQVQLFANLNMEEKLKMRARSSPALPTGCWFGRNRTKYIDPIMFLLTYHGILATRDAFSAGSAADQSGAGFMSKEPLKRIQPQMIAAAQYMEASLFKEYWGKCATNKRIQEWLRMQIFTRRAPIRLGNLHAFFFGGA